MHRCLNAPVFGSDALLYGASDCWGTGLVGLLLQVFVTRDLGRADRAHEYEYWGGMNKKPESLSRLYICVGA